jgi:hypothetical protein
MPGSAPPFVSSAEILQARVAVGGAREIALAMIDAIDAQIAPLERELRQLARRQAGCRALMGLYGMGELTSLITLCELGDVRRLSASRKAVRMAGIDIGVHRSDRRARVGKLNRQGSPHLRWALYEAALAACRPSSPDHADYLALKARGLSHTRASLTIARKLARRCFHILNELGPAALEPTPGARARPAPLLHSRRWSRRRAPLPRFRFRLAAGALDGSARCSVCLDGAARPTLAWLVVALLLIAHCDTLSLATRSVAGRR